MRIYKIRIAASLYQQLELKTSTFSNEQQAIDTVKAALEKNDIKFTMQDGNDKKIFLNESGGELAAIVPA